MFANSEQQNPEQQFQLRALIADDDAFNRKTVIKTLEHLEEQVDVTECHTATEAFELLSTEHFDIALVAQNLPDELGTGLLQRLKNVGILQVPVILLTDTDEVGEEVIRLGAQEFLSKETRSVQQMKKSIRYSLERHRLWQELVISKERQRREHELRLLETSVGHSQAALAHEDEYEKNFAKLRDLYAQIFDVFVQDNSFKREKHGTEQIREFAATLGRLGAGPKELVRIHRSFLELMIKDKPVKREDSLTNESRYFLLQLMGELLLFYRDRPRL